MPQNKFSVATANKFACGLDSDSDSGSDEVCKTFDPNSWTAKMTAEATKKAKLMVKQKEAEAKKQALMEQAVAKTEVVVEKKEPEKKREPRANQGRRYGRRDGDEKKGGFREGGQGGDNRDVKAVDSAGDNNKDRRYKRPKGQDRKSGMNTGRKAVEKRGGGGANNWGKATDLAEEDVEQATKEETDPTAEKVDSGNENEDAEQVEDAIVELSLDDYMASLNVKEDDAKTAPNRQANDGKELKGRVAKKKIVHNDHLAKVNPTQSRDNAKPVVGAGLLGFKSDYSRRGGNINRNDNRRGENRKNKSGNQPKEFKIEEDAFPTLGKK